MRSVLEVYPFPWQDGRDDMITRIMQFLDRHLVFPLLELFSVKEIK